MAIKVDPNAASAAADAVNYRKTEARKGEEQKLAYRDADGRAFNLSISLGTGETSAVYDRKSLLKPGAQGGKEETARTAGAEEGAPASVPGDDPTLEKAVEEFRNSLINQLLKKTFKLEAGEWVQIKGAESGALTAATEGGKTLTIEMDVVDTEYWSVENTARRLVDFATSLYGGGDRGEHLAKMTDGLEQGFEAAKEAFGGALPEISRQTVDLAKKMLADWANEGTSTGQVPGLAV